MSDQPTSKDEGELRTAELALRVAKETEGRAYDAWRDAVEDAHVCAENVNRVRALHAASSGGTRDAWA